MFKTTRKLKAIFREESGPSILVELEFGDVGFCEGRKTGEPGKNLVAKGNGYEAQQTSKDQTLTKMPRFRLEGPRPCTIVCFALIYYA